MTDRRIWIPAVLFALAGLGACASATDPAAFQAGVAAYDAGDYGRAYSIWAPLAKRGDLAAQRNVAHLRRQGLGVKQDPKAALELYREAAERGLVGAQVNLAFLYLEGQGTEKNVREAVRWFQRAARNGSAEAQFQLARMLEEGDGLNRNWDKAVIYYLAAAGQGHVPAQRALVRMKFIAEHIKGLVPLERPDTRGNRKVGVSPLYGGTRNLPVACNLHLVFTSCRVPFHDGTWDVDILANRPDLSARQVPD